MSSSFVVGVNYPWLRCGWDFGPAPHGWNPTKGEDWGLVEREFTNLRALGITVARFWLLAGGVNFPVGKSVRSVADRKHDWLGRGTFRLKPGTSLPHLPDAFLADFRALCTAALNAGMQLIPSLLSFEWFDYAAEHDTRGRKEFVFGTPEDDYRVAMARFLSNTLDPLLAVSGARRQAIYAWEVINEPDWVVRGGPFHARIGKTVEPWHMDGLIYEAFRRIERAGFVTTVGFKEAHPAWVQPYLWEVLTRAGQRASYIHQAHHYPTLISDHTLAPASESPIQPVLLGEFPSSDALSLGNVRWSDLRDTERDPSRYLYGRLALAKSLGYAGAFPWSVRATDNRTLWTERQEAQVHAFASGGSLPVA